MTDLWQLPKKAVIGAGEYGIDPDFRNILDIFKYLDDRTLPEYLRWQIALGLFYDKPIPKEDQHQAIQALCRFIAGGEENRGLPHKLLDWQLDADLIVSDVNKVAGLEIRALPYVHWWTFLSWFHGIRDGQLSLVVTIRDKLRRGKKLEMWEQEYFRLHKDRILMRPPLSPREQAEKARLEQMLL